MTARHTIRDATEQDAPPIASIYGHYVLTSPATFEEIPPSSEEIASRMAQIVRAGLPWRVAVDPDGTLLGYAYASLYRTRSAYRYTLENSVYIAPAAARQDIGAALMRDVIERCVSLGYRQMLAVIGDSANSASIGLHAHLGFAMIGTHPAIGFKFGRWIDVVHMQLALGDGSFTPPR